RGCRSLPELAESGCVYSTQQSAPLLGGSAESRADTMGAAVDEITAEELVHDPYEVYRRLRDAGPCVWLAPARRYVVPRWDDVFAVDENDAFTAAEPESLMTRAIGLSMLRTDGDDHQRQRRAAHRVLRAKEFETYWSGMLAGVADELIDEFEAA